MPHAWCALPAAAICSWAPALHLALWRRGHRWRLQAGSVICSTCDDLRCRVTRPLRSAGASAAVRLRRCGPAGACSGRGQWVAHISSRVRSRQAPQSCTHLYYGQCQAGSCSHCTPSHTITATAHVHLRARSWGGETSPSVCFRSLICKPRPRGGAPPRTVVGEFGPGLSDWDFGRPTARCATTATALVVTGLSMAPITINTPTLFVCYGWLAVCSPFSSAVSLRTRYCFENDVPINMEGQEALLDWGFDRLGISSRACADGICSSCTYGTCWLLLCQETSSSFRCCCCCRRHRRRWSCASPAAAHRGGAHAWWCALTVGTAGV
jgi:hypothetical protein